MSSSGVKCTKFLNMQILHCNNTNCWITKYYKYKTYNSYGINSRVYKGWKRLAESQNITSTKHTIHMGLTQEYIKDEKD